MNNNRQQILAAAKRSAELRSIPMIGRKFFRLVVIDSALNGPSGKRWFCVCDCGSSTIATGCDLRNGHTKSCGCWSRDVTAAIKTVHGNAVGKKATPELTSWNQMRRRCFDPTTKEYRHYGGRGIKICHRWLTFLNFLSDMGRRPSIKHSLDRIDVNGDYEPRNCRWATSKTQQNNRRNNRIVTWNGRTKTLSQWSEERNISVATLKIRLDRWSVGDAMTRELRSDKRRDAKRI